MRLKRALRLTLLLPQFALLLWFAFGDMRELRHEVQTGYSRPMTECLSYPPFSVWEFGCELLGLAGIISLCGSWRWARLLYLGFVLWLLVGTLPNFVHSPSGNGGLLPIYALIAVTVTLCFSWLSPASSASAV